MSRPEWQWQAMALSALFAVACIGDIDEDEEIDLQAPVAESQAGPVFGASADASVFRGRPDTNYGGTSDLVSDRDPEWQTYLRFQVSGVMAPIVSAHLRLYITNSSKKGPALYRTSSAWTENGITWNNKPNTTGAAVANLGAVKSGAYVEYDVKSVVTGNGSYDFAVVPESSDSVHFRSREAGTGVPQLVISTTVPSTPTSPTSPSGSPGSLAFPIRAAFYYPWFPETWGSSCQVTKFQPSLGCYRSDDVAVVRKHIEAMRYGNIAAGIASWWGPSKNDEQTRIPMLLEESKAEGNRVRWALYHENEGYSNPSVDELRAQLTYIRDRYAGHESYLRVGGKFVVFVYNADDTSCAVASRWKQANTVGAHIVLKVFAGYATCSDQPDSWHQYGPAARTHAHLPNSFAISPGFWLWSESGPRLARDITQFKQNISDMVASQAKWQLVTSFNEWGEGTAVESATEWSSGSGYGAYLDALHDLHDTGSTTPDAGTPPVPADAGAPDASVVDAMPTDGGTTPPSPVVVAAGDIAGSWPEDTATSNLVSAINPRAVLLLGDNAYNSGTLKEFNDYFAPSWGIHFNRIFPSPGNHDHSSPNLAGYCSYFGARAHCTNGFAYHSFDIGEWHIISLDSGCSSPASCTDPLAPGTAQRAWLAADLAANRKKCTLAYWHHPRFSSGDHGNDSRVDSLWRELYAAGVDVVLSGHDHNYERFLPQTPDAQQNPNGMVGFVVGTGGVSLRAMTTTKANSAVRNNNTHGVLKLTLHPTRYDYEFVPVVGKTFTDKGSGACR